jgi:hypothetical protein
MMNLFPYNGQHVPFQIETGRLFVDGKTILKNTFTSAANFIQEVGKFDGVKTDGGRSPLWVPVALLAQFMADKSHSTRTENGQNFDWTAFQDSLFDFLYDQGHTEFISERRKKVEAEAKEKIARENEMRLAKLEKELAQMREAESARLNNEKEKARAGVNPVIKALNSVWFPVVISGIFATVIGGFSYEILSTTMGLNPYLNALLAFAWVMFPVLTAIRQYTFDVGRYHIQPLWIVMLVDMVFTAYHVGWLRVETPVEGGVEVATMNLHWLIKSVYVIIIPLMQKATNEMLLKIRATYLVKGWLPKVD